MSEQKKQSKIVGRTWQFIGIILILIGVGTFFIVPEWTDLGLIPEVIIRTLATSCSLLGMRTFNHGKKHLVPAADAAISRDTRPPVLYLRSFKSDSLTSRPVSAPEMPLDLATEEETIATIMNQVGPFIAIGEPGEELPQVGAARMYVGDDKWQDTVLDLMARAQLVVLRAGQTPGFWWEVEQVVQIVNPRRILLLIPFKEEQYEVFRRKADGILPQPLPPYTSMRFSSVSLRGIIYFDSDWTPHFVTAYKRLNQSYSQLQIVFYSVFDLLNIPYSPLPRLSFGKHLLRLLLVALLAILTCAAGGVVLWILSNLG